MLLPRGKASSSRHHHIPTRAERKQLQNRRMRTPFSGCRRPAVLQKPTGGVKSFFHLETHRHPPLIALRCSMALCLQHSNALTVHICARHQSPHEQATKARDIQETGDGRRREGCGRAGGGGGRHHGVNACLSLLRTLRHHIRHARRGRRRTRRPTRDVACPTSHTRRRVPGLSAPPNIWPRGPPRKHPQ